jgi:hypothetical protein
LDGNQELKLNGAGVRTKFASKSAAVPLYVQEPKITIDDILAEPGPKRLIEALMQKRSTIPCSTLYFCELGWVIAHWIRR